MPSWCPARHPAGLASSSEKIRRSHTLTSPSSPPEYMICDDESAKQTAFASSSWAFICRKKHEECFFNNYTLVERLPRTQPPFSPFHICKMLWKICPKWLELLQHGPRGSLPTVTHFRMPNFKLKSWCSCSYPAHITWLSPGLMQMRTC